MKTISLAHALLLTTLLLLSSPTLPAQSFPEEQTLVLYREAAEAYAAKNYPLFLEKTQQAIALVPTQPTLRMMMARAHALLGNRAEALRWLEAMLRTGALRDIRNHPDFASLRDAPEFTALLARFDALRNTAAPASTLAFSIPERDLIPESVAYDPQTRAFFVGSIYKRKILRRTADGKLEDFVPAKSSGLTGVLGIKVDAKRRVLWANACNLGADMPMIDPEPDSVWTGALYQFDLASAKLIRKFPVGTKDDPDCFNDLAITSAGDVYVTAGRTGRIYRVLAGRDKLELFYAPARPGLVQLNGIAVSPDDKFLYASASAIGVLRIEISSRRAALLPTPPDVSLSGIDGLYATGSTLIAMQQLGEAERIARFDLSPAGDRVLAAHTLEAGAHLDAPTGVIVSGVLYFVSGMQLDQLMAARKPDGSAAPMPSLREPQIRKLALTPSTN